LRGIAKANGVKAEQAGRLHVLRRVIDKNTAACRQTEPQQEQPEDRRVRFDRSLGIAEFKGLARFDTLQAYYSIAGRDIEREIVPLLESEKVGLLVWSPLAGGLLSGKFSRTNQKPEGSRRTEYDFPLVDKERTWNILDVMAPIAKAHGCTAARLSLAWLLAKPVVTSVIIGAKRLDQLQDNLAAIELTLTQDELRQLDEVSALALEYPGWVLPFQGADRLGPADRWERLREAS
jgi:aryl-alcohol dehydrogenase-like predicted oxidoreductase